MQKETPMTNSDLASRLLTGSGKDVELDWALDAHFGNESLFSNKYYTAPSYTDDLNATIALLEQELPGYSVRSEGPFKTGSYSTTLSLHDSERYYFAIGPDRCRALLLALLAAKDARS